MSENKADNQNSPAGEAEQRVDAAPDAEQLVDGEIEELQDVSDTASTEKNEAAAEVAAEVAEQSDANNSSPDQDETEAAPVAAAKAPGKGLAWLALLIALLAAGGAGYLGWLLLQEQEAGRGLVDMSESNHQRVNTFQRELDKVEKQLAKEREARLAQASGLQQELAEANTLIEGQSRRLLSLTATTTDDWRLAEVEYLLRLANQRILTSKDGRTALNLLQSADEILVELGDPRLFEVRKAIANDRAALSVVGQLDLDGVFLQLSALGAQVEKLPLLRVPEFSVRAAQDNAEPIAVGADAASDGATSGVVDKLREIGRSTWAELKSLVVIQQQDASVKPLLPPDQQYYLRNNLRLLINQAQLALLDGRQAPYSESLRSAVAWMQDYFPMKEAANAQVARQLADLSEVVVAAEYPDVSASLIAIKAFIAEQHRRSSGQAAGAKQ
ncbi:MAG: uroporphyrinogen-III C-methyltransferase [Gammaproteobacteria bacterium]|nr:uroporphyrinogen-III C-methyltransferase [Gammaproteobacteria bacterium]MBT8150199.1 uroporphyrinogen-III C-methyltransferase [Gammaproteobacteria bacterium]NND38497.1 hypothetical protein [Pseudomonadales bacterium]NNM11381.1 hypothetical protein [Pseudomonadales bacterium]RZV57969.1 MAG: hypothetical protein EX270_03100 [Pseudomonadales bacterium]